MKLDWEKVDVVALKKLAERDTERLLNLYSLLLLRRKKRTWEEKNE